jgi:FkbM family methyltransferase
MPDYVETAVPGRPAIELVAYYEVFRDYYPQCELETKRWFVENVQSDWWILDIGANIGYYTILFAQLASRGRVLAFEPTTTASMLRQNLRHHNIDNAEVHELALGAVTGALEDRIYRLWGTEGEVKTYPFSRLDDFLEQRHPARIDCLKIDVDSFDFEVLRGAERTLMKYDPVIVIELNDALAKRHQSPSDALEWLAQRGYSKALVLDRENFMLRRTQNAFAGVANAWSMELLFPSPRPLDERLPPGANAAAQVIRSARLENGATMRQARAEGDAIAGDASQPGPSILDRLLRRRPAFPTSDSRFAFRSILDVPIETGSVKWNYALVLELQASPEALGTLSIEFAVEVQEGRLGIGLAGKEDMLLASRERLLSAMPGVQRVILTATRAGAHLLILRTTAQEGTKTVFTVKSVDVRLQASD